MSTSMSTSMRRVNWAHGCEAVNQGAFRADYFFHEPKAFPRNWDVLRWSFFQRVGGR
jgi:hypothetical protein